MTTVAEHPERVMSPAPVVVFVYNRPEHVRRALSSLKENALASETELFVYSDGGKNPADWERVKEIRAWLRTLEGFRNLTIVERDENFGLARSIIAGVSEIVDRYGRVIVLEDDLVVSPVFLEYMNRALEFFRDDERVVSIHGYVYPVTAPLPEAFFLRGADCWGWATWRRGWEIFCEDSVLLAKRLREEGLIRSFDMEGRFPYYQMLKDQIAGKNDSWAIRWHASAFLAGKLTLYPGCSFVQNIGLDSSGTHCGSSSSYDVSLNQSVPRLNRIPVEENLVAREAIGRHLATITENGIWKRLLGKLRRWRGV